MKKKQILNYSIALSIVIALFVVFTVVITASGSEDSVDIQYAESQTDSVAN